MGQQYIVGTIHETVFADEVKFKPILFLSDDNLIVFNLQTPEFLFGYVLLIINDCNKFEKYKSAIGNLINIMTINLENIHQKIIIREYRKKIDELEEEVKKHASALSEEILQHIQVQRVLGESEARYRDLANMVPVGIFETDINGVITYVNNMVFEWFGFSETDLSAGLNLGNFLLEGDQSGPALNFKDIIETKPATPCECLARRKNYTFFPVCVSLFPVIKYGRIIGLRGTITDISERKQLEAILKQSQGADRNKDVKKMYYALKESEERFNQVIEMAEEWIWEMNPRGLYTYSNSVVEKILGYKPDEVVGLKHFYDFYPPENREQLKSDTFKRFSARKNIRRIVNLYLHKNGQKVDLEVSGLPLFNSRGDFLGYRGVSHDITKRFLYEEELYKLYLAVEQSPVSIVITNMNGAIEYVNPAFSHVTGYSYEEVIGQNPRILKSGKTASKYYQDLWTIITSGNEWKGEFCNRKKNGDLYWESASISPIYNSKGKITHFVAVKEDITEKREIERLVFDKIIETEENERLRYSNELHDGLGPVISTIKLYLQLLTESDKDDQRIAIIERANKCIDEAMRTIKEISHNLSPNVLNNFGLVAGIQNFINRLNETHVFLIDFECNVDRRFERNVEITFYRIITELVNNTFMHSGASLVKIELHYMEQKSLLLFEYSDNGCGFDVEEVTRKGRGLGLSNLRQRIKTLNGNIKIDSSPGKGMKVSIDVEISSMNE